MPNYLSAVTVPLIRKKNVQSSLISHRFSVKIMRVRTVLGIRYGLTCLIFTRDRI